MQGSLQENDMSFKEEVARRSGQNVTECYQCGNCTAGCPFNFAYDIPVTKIMRLVQLGQRDMVLRCHSIWLCASCQTCTTRCPNSIDVAKVMDVLRHMSREAGYATERNIKAFGDSFLASVKRNGRLHELGVAVGYEVRTGRILTDIDLAPAVIGKGKLSLRPHSIQGADQVAGIFNRFNERTHE